MCLYVTSTFSPLSQMRNDMAYGAILTFENQASLVVKYFLYLSFTNTVAICSLNELLLAIQMIKT
jgi:hypothetical protein